MGITLGDVDVSVGGMAEITVENANFSFENFLQINSKFNPYAVGAGLLLDIWRASDARRQHAEQMQVLREISAKLDKLNDTAEQILTALNALPEKLGHVFGVELLKNDLSDKWATLDTCRIMFLTDKNYSPSSDELAAVAQAFTYVCTHEFRTSHLVGIPRVAEVINYISKAQLMHYVRALITLADVRVREYQSSIGRAMVKATAEFLENVIALPPRRWPNGFTTLHIRSNYRSIDDLRQIVLEAYAEPKASYDLGIFQQWAVKGGQGSEIAQVPNVQKMLDATKSAYVEESTQLFESFNNFSALRKLLQGVATFDFDAALK